MESTDLNWRKASYTNGGENCVETASDSGVILVRDTKLRGGAMLTLSIDAWRAFTSSIK